MLTAVICIISFWLEAGVALCHRPRAATMALISGNAQIVRENECCCVRQWMQAAPQPLLHACIREDAATAPLEVLRIKRLNHRPACILMFSGTLRHLVLPEVTRRGARELPAVVAALMLLQVPADPPPPPPPAPPSLSAGHFLLGRANLDLHWPRSHHARLLALNAA